jgi:ankyrin repeat protein
MAVQLQHLVAASALVAMPLGLAWLATSRTDAERCSAWFAPAPEAAPIAAEPNFLRRAARLDARPARRHFCAQIRVVIQAGIASALASPDARVVPAGALNEACIQEQALLVRGLLTAGADPNERDEGGTPALIHAASARSSTMVALLLAAGADPHAELEDRTQAIHLAARFGVAASLRALLSAGVSVEALDDQECTPLWNAAAEGNLETVEFLLDAGARVDARDIDGRTPLHPASHSDRPAILRALCAAGAPLEARDDRGWTPLLIAVQLGSVEMVETLLEHGAELHAVDHERRSALHLAVASSRREIVQLLLARGIDRHGKNARGETAMEHGLGQANLETMEALWKGEPATRASSEPDRLEMQRFALSELEALAERRELAELRVHGFDPAFLEPSTRSSLVRLRIEQALPSHEHCSETRCVSEPGERWQLSSLAEQESGRWSLVVQRYWNFCPRDTRPPGGLCGNGSTLAYELVPFDGQWYVASTHVGGDFKIRRLPRR